MSKRFKFFLGHFTISLFIALFFIGIIFFVWYPDPLAKAAGVTHIFLMLILIDVIIGPLLSFFVYKEGKETLKIDLIVIILIQFSALSYGMYNIMQGRPAWIIYNIDRFELVRNNDVILDHVDQVQPQYQTPSLFGPQIIAIKQSMNPIDLNRDIMEVLATGIPVSRYPERYTSLAQQRKQLVRNVQSLDKLKQFNEPQIVQNILSNYPQANAWLPLSATDVDMTVLINKENGEVVKIVDLRPWS